VKARVHELVRFGLVGGFNAGTAYGLYVLGLLVGVPYLLAATIAFALSASMGYWMHEHYTFKGGAPTLRGWASWLAAQGAASGLNLVLLAVAVDGFGANKYLAQLVLLFVSPAATYVVGRRWVFSKA
jgi:putative flippase GtrA